MSAIGLAAPVEAPVEALVEEMPPRLRLAEDVPRNRNRKTKGRRSPNREQQDEIVRLYRTGLSLDAVGERVYWSRGTVKNVLRRRGVALRSRGATLSGRRVLPAEEFEQTADLYRGGLSVGEVARRQGIGESTVRYRLGMAGVTLRDLSTAQRAHDAHRVASGGLTRRQTTVLALLDEAPGRLTTTQIAEALSCPVREARSTMLRLERLDLVRGRRVGPSVPTRWLRTGRRTSDALCEFVASLPCDAEREPLPSLPGRPLGEVLARIAAREKTTVDPDSMNLYERAGIDDSASRKWLTGKCNVRVDTADRVVTRLGLAWWEIWTRPEREPNGAEEVAAYVAQTEVYLLAQRYLGGIQDS